MARVDAMVQQQCAGHINLECGLVATTFQHHCGVVLKKRHTEEVLEEADAVAGYAELGRLCTNPTACECEYNEEVALAENYIDKSEADIEAAQAYLAVEDALFAHDVAVGEAEAESLALDEHLLGRTPDYHRVEYPFSRFYLYECGCEGRYGVNDDGEIIHYDCP
jgi:hypothetical protein